MSSRLYLSLRMLENRSLLEVRRQARKKVFKPDAGIPGCKCKRPLSSLVLPAHGKALSRWGGGGLESSSARVGQNHARPAETLASTGPAWLQFLALALPAVALDKLFVFSKRGQRTEMGTPMAQGPVQTERCSGRDSLT